MRLNSFPVRIAVVYGALFSGLGIMLPFLPVWLSARGLTVGEIAAVLAVQSAVRVAATPVISFFADRTGRRRLVVLALAIASASGILVLSQAHGFAAIIVVVAATYALWSPVLPLFEAYAVAGAEAHGHDYARLRLWGSLSFIAGSLGAGVMLDYVAAENVIFLLLAAYIIMAVALVGLPNARPGNVLPDDGQARPSFSQAKVQLASWTFIVFLAAASLAQASHAVYYGFGSVHWQSIGYSGGLIGVLWSIGVIAEVVLFALGGASVRTAVPAVLILIGALGGAVRWAGTSLDPSLGVLVGLQALHGISFGATHLGTMFFIRRYIPKELAGTAQGVYSAVGGGLAMTLAIAAAGALYARYGAGAYLAMAGLSLAAAVFALILIRLNPTEPKVEET